MELTLVPICSEIDHVLNYDYKIGYSCEICKKSDISYRCANCDYGRCSGCHRDVLASERIKERLRIAKLKNDIKISENSLKVDKLDDWGVMVSNGEICYINKLTRSYSFDYPYSGKTLGKSPDTKPDISPDITPDEIHFKNDGHVRCSFTEIINTIKSYF